MKTNLSIGINPIHFEVGWYRGEEVSLFLLRFGNVSRDHLDRVSYVGIIEIQLVKFFVSLYLVRR